MPCEGLPLEAEETDDKFTILFLHRTPAVVNWKESPE